MFRPKIWLLYTTIVSYNYFGRPGFPLALNSPGVTPSVVTRRSWRRAGPERTESNAA